VHLRQLPGKEKKRGKSGRARSWPHLRCCSARILKKRPVEYSTVESEKNPNRVRKGRRRKRRAEGTRGTPPAHPAFPSVPGAEHARGSTTRKGKGRKEGKTDHSPGRSVRYISLGRAAGRTSLFPAAARSPERRKKKGGGREGGTTSEPLRQCTASLPRISVRVVAQCRGGKKEGGRKKKRRKGKRNAQGGRFPRRKPACVQLGNNKPVHPSPPAERGGKERGRGGREKTWRNEGPSLRFCALPWAGWSSIVLHRVSGSPRGEKKRRGGRKGEEGEDGASSNADSVVAACSASPAAAFREGLTFARLPRRKKKKRRGERGREGVDGGMIQRDDPCTLGYLPCRVVSEHTGEGKKEGKERRGEER